MWLEISVYSMSFSEVVRTGIDFNPSLEFLILVLISFLIVAFSYVYSHSEVSSDKPYFIYSLVVVSLIFSISFVALDYGSFEDVSVVVEGENLDEAQITNIDKSSISISFDYSDVEMISILDDRGRLVKSMVINEGESSVKIEVREDFFVDEEGFQVVILDSNRREVDRSSYSINRTVQTVQ